MRLRQDRSGNLDCGHSIVSGFSVILLKPLIGVGKDKESGKEFQGYFRISAGKDRGYFVSAVPNKRRRCIKEIEEKKKSTRLTQDGAEPLPWEKTKVIVHVIRTKP